jgi:glycosyltransferase involved in cell wall biosynthesis
MRILLANYRYFVSGGPERYMFNVIDVLNKHGHRVVPFSIHYKYNKPSAYSSYFVDPLGRKDEVFFREQQMRPGTVWRTLKRLFYAPEVEHAVGHLVEDTQPQIAYVLHYLRKLSPSLLVGLKKAKIPIVVRLSDYAMLCPQAHCLRDGKPCKLCVQGDLWPSIRYRCVQDSLIASFLNATATWYHHRAGFFDLIDVFLTTNRFMYDLMRKAGFSENRLCVIPTFVNGLDFYPNPNFAKKDYIVYAGRLEAVKGLHILVEALSILQRRQPNLDVSLKVAGWGSEEYESSIQRKIQREGLHNLVDFVGKLDTDDLSRLLRGAKLSIIPSLWYENLPNALLESYACGTPVIASRLGSLANCVRDGETGYLFNPGDAEDLAKKIVYCLEHPKELTYMSKESRREAEERYAPEKHFSALIDLFSKLI